MGEEVVGDGCSNNINFTSSFHTDSGASCSTCAFCEGFHLSSIFDPKVESMCIDCTTADNECVSLKVTTAFDKAWIMKFIRLASSGLGFETDPENIAVQASKDLSSWTEIYDSQLSF